MKTTKKNKCSHGNTTQGPDRCFTRQVASNNDYANRAAHGGIAYTETCMDCGASRETNQNQRHLEHSPWGPDSVTQARFAARAEDEAAKRAALIEAEEARKLLQSEGIRVEAFDPSRREILTSVCGQKGQWTREDHMRKAAAQCDPDLSQIYRAILFAALNFDLPRGN